MPEAKTKEYFVHLKRLVSLEEGEENEEIRSEFLELTPQERELRGKALLDLRLLERHFSPAEHVLATFVKADGRPFPIFSLDMGDIVTVFAEGEKLSECPTGTVYEKEPGAITVAFGASPLPEWMDLPLSGIPDRRYQLHKSVNRVTYRRMGEALEAVLETRNTRLAVLRDISLGLRRPEVKDLKPEHLDWFDPGLNESQRRAVLRALEAVDVALVHGPPGTGKTTALVEIIRQAVAAGEAVFVTAPSNTACDNVLERLVEKGVNALRLGHPARIAASLREHTLDFKLALHPLAADVTRLQAELTRLFKREDRYRGRRSPEDQDAGRRLRDEIAQGKADVRKLKAEIFDRVMRETEVIVGTPTGIQDRAIRERDFDLVVIDEATQATEPMSWIPLTRARRVVMAGDHFQLPPTVRSKEAEAKGLGVTLFERYYEILGPESKILLERQYRMHETIMGFSSREFYKGLLVADESVRARTLAGLAGVERRAETEEPFLFVDTAGKGFEERLEAGSESRYNPEEAGLVLGFLEQFLTYGVPASEIAVISPYSAQVRLLSSRTPDPAVEIDSVDGFQGREKELVIVSLVRSNLEGEMGFLTDTRRMNVAMTRAKRKLVVIGDSATLSSIAFYRDLLRYAEEKGAYKSAWEL